MNDHTLTEVVEKTAAGASVAGGGWMTYQAVMNGLNMAAVIMGIVVSLLASWWWVIKIRKESKRE